MVNTCCVPGCKSGYRSAQQDQDVDKPALFKFPNDEELRSKWIKAIPRKDWLPTNASRVCSKHFYNYDFKLTSSDSRNDRRYARESQTLQRRRLNPGAIPQIFPNLASYLTSKPVTSRSIASTSAARIEKENATIDSLNQDFLEQQDMIEDLDMLKIKLESEVLPTGFVKIINENSVQFHYLTTNFESSRITTPKLLASSIITEDLKLHSFILESPVPCSVFDDLIMAGKVTRMSGLLNALARQKSMISLSETDDPNSQSNNLLELVLLFLNQFIEQQNQSNVDEEGTMIQLVQFLVEQLRLCQVSKHARRYSTKTIKTAFLWQLTSTALYKKLKAFFVLPSIRWLQNLASVSSVTGGSVDLGYLKTKSNTLSAKEKLVTLIIDEVYVAERVEYANGRFIGITENGTPAKTVLSFMIQSIYNSYKDVVCLIPVSRLDTVTLHAWFLKVMEALGSLFHVVAVSTDNHVCNRKLFLDLCGGELQFFIPHPTRTDDQLFLLFDFTHNFKNIFNNFIGKERFNLPAAEFPDMFGQSCVPHFGHIKKLYALEECKTLKVAHALKKVSLNPSNLARTSPHHALSVFSESTARGLMFYSEEYPEFADTAVFVEFICNVWKVMSLKTPSKGFRKNDDLCKPLNLLERSSIDFLIKARNVFIKWKQSGNAGLTKETFLACLQSIGAMIELASYLHNQHEFRYILPGKFMSDPIEARFGWYRQASGGNFFMSVRQLMLSEKKIRVLSLLQQKMLREASTFTLGTVGTSVTTSGSAAAADIEWLYDFFLRNDVEDLNLISLTDANVTYFVSGYIARSICRQRKCESCKSLLLAGERAECIEEYIPQEYMTLFDDTNRGGLSAPTELCFAITALAVQSYTAISANDNIKLKLLTTPDQRGTFTLALTRLAETSSNILQRQICSKKHDNFKLILQVAFNCFAKNELKRLNCRKVDPPAKMQRTARKLCSNASAKQY